MPFADFAAQFGGPTEEDARIVVARDYNARHPDAPIKPGDIGQGSMVNDMGHAFAAGVNALASLPFWLEEKAEEALGLDWLAEKAKGTRQYFERSAEEKRQNYSADMKVAQDKEFITEGPDGYGMGDAWTDPRAVGGMIAESLPSMLGGMGIGAKIATGLTKAGVSRGLAWAIGSSIGEGGVAGAQDSQNVYNTVMDMPEETLARSPEYQELLKTMSPPEARKALADNIAWETGWQTGLSTGALSAPAGALFGKMLGGETGKTLLRSIGKQALADGLEETAQSGAEQYLQQNQLRRADQSIEPMQGVFNAAVAGGVSGAVMGGGMGPLGHDGGRRTRERAGENTQDMPSQEENGATSPSAAAPYVFEQSPGNMSVPSMPAVDPDEIIYEDDYILMVPSFPHRAPGIFNSAFPMGIPLIC